MIQRFSFLLLFLPFCCAAIDFDPLLTAKANKAKQQAEEAFNKKEYATAIAKYRFLLDTLKINDEKAQLNLAHSYMRKADYANATSHYTKSTSATDPVIRSIAYQQLGILRSEKGEKEEAKAYFKNALRHNPANTDARHNYELLVRAKEKEMPKPQDQKERKEQEQKNKQEEQKKEQKKDPQQGDSDNKKDTKGNNDGQKEDKKGQDKSNKGQEKDKEDTSNDNEKEGKDSKDKTKDPKDSKGQSNNDNKVDNPSKEGDKKQEKSKEDEQGDKKGKVEDAVSQNGEKKDKRDAKTTIVNKEQLQRMNMTEQQAKSLLNAMRQQEVQYIQQQKKQSPKQGDTKNYKDW